MQPQQSAQHDGESTLPAPDDPGPRYVAPAGGPRVAGTHAGAVAGQAGLPLRLDRTSALHLIAFDGYDAQRSFFEGVRMVPARHELTRDADGRIVVLPASAPERLRLRVKEAAERLRQHIDAATAARIEGTERVGVLLSGGLDSSAVAAAAARTWKERGQDPAHLCMYHMLPPVGPSEVEHARAVAEHLGHRLVEVAPEEDEAEEERLLGALDFPTAAAGPAPSLAMLKRAAEEGSELVLTGDGGDEAFAAYGTKHERGAHGVLAARAHVAFGGWMAGLRRRLGPLAPGFVRRGDDTRLPPWLAEQVRGLARPEALPEPRAGLRAVAAARDRSLRAARQARIVAWWRTAGAQHGLRASFPLLAPRVTDFVVALPQHVFATAPRPKDLLRRAVGERLPERQRQRPKDQPYVEPWLRARLREHAAAWSEHYLAGGVLEALGVVPATAAASMLRDAADAPADGLYRALALLGLERWCRANLP